MFNICTPIISLYFNCFHLQGADGGLDFGVTRVGDEAKQTCTLKNKGKYEISFRFYFEPNDKSPSKLNELFTVNPANGTLIQNDRPTQVQVCFRGTYEISVKEQPILKCQVLMFNLTLS